MSNIIYILVEIQLYIFVEDVTIVLNFSKLVM